ncbi:hypothetical protein AMTR_s00062p00089640 [Amborella trichopoda]|uniref:AAA+ ATPase domain-containing protein n=2 Tax=Amborella trichopoda TaxID=13333 RepID=U5DAN4_AMBTC|nr:hypothetical protein AMTR_s00062p00089640 [Amborella trichopoda]
MYFLEPISEILKFLWVPLIQQIGYLINLQDNVEEMRRQKEELCERKKDVMIEVAAAEREGMTPTNQVREWLNRSDIIEAEVDQLDKNYRERNGCLGGHFPACYSRHKLGREVANKLKDVASHKDKAAFERVAFNPPPLMVEEKPVASIAGQTTTNKTLNDIMSLFREEEVGIIGIYGMGGVGKTTLIKHVNNHLIASREYSAIFWVTVSKDSNIDKIRKAIMRQLGMRFSGDDDEEQIAEKLFKRLRELKFVVILDDVWKSLDIDAIRIPRPNKENGSKIVFTTRSLEVCHQMDADKSVKVEVLQEEEAWTLFRQKAGNEVETPPIESTAKEVVKECGGLPLALITVGRAMREKRSIEVWQNAARALRGSSPEITGMESQVFLPLQYSYDQLGDDVKRCFLYSSVFPEDHAILKDFLVEYWIFEELIGGVDNIADARNKGNAIIQSLIDS